MQHIILSEYRNYFFYEECVSNRFHIAREEILNRFISSDYIHLNDGEMHPLNRVWSDLLNLMFAEINRFRN